MTIEQGEFTNSKTLARKLLPREIPIQNQIFTKNILQSKINLLLLHCTIILVQ